MTVKKAFVEIINFLNENSDKKVKSILEEVTKMASAKAGGSGGASTHLKDKNGVVVAIQDYYFKRWMPLVGDLAVEFGAKKNTPTGYNTMCKEGVSNWTKQQRIFKQASQELLTRVANKEVSPEDIPTEQARLEEERKSIVETELGFATKEEVIAYLNDNNIELSEDTANAA